VAGLTIRPKHIVQLMGANPFHWIGFCQTAANGKRTVNGPRIRANRLNESRLSGIGYTLALDQKNKAATSCLIAASIIIGESESSPVGSLVRHDHFVDDHVPTLFHVVNANFRVLTNFRSFNHFSFGRNIGNALAEPIMSRFASAGA
jgi:hypothetical protein